MLEDDLISTDFRLKSDPYELTEYDGMILARHHVFSAYNKAMRENGDGMELAGKALAYQHDGNRIDTNPAKGVDVETRFYHRFRNSLNLVPALDCGDHTDFVGLVDGQLTRYDVTANLQNKTESDYVLSNQYVVEWSNQGKQEKWHFYRVVDGKFVFNRTI